MSLQERLLDLSADLEDRNTAIREIQVQNLLHEAAAELEASQARVARLVAVAKASQEVRKDERWTWTKIVAALDALLPGDLPVEVES